MNKRPSICHIWHQSKVQGMEQKGWIKLLLGLLLGLIARPRVTGFTYCRRGHDRGHANDRRLTSKGWGAGIHLHSNKDNKDETRTDDQNPSPPSPREKQISKGLEEDIAKKLTHSRDQAISALSQPASTSEQRINPKERAISKLSTPEVYNKQRGNNRRNNNGRSKSGNRPHKRDSLLPKTSVGFSKYESSNGKNSRGISRDEENNWEDNSLFSLLPPSLLPPPLRPSGFASQGVANESIAEGLSSWEDFLGAGSPTKASRGDARKPPGRIRSQGSYASNYRNDASQESSTTVGGDSSLPSIADLFPPDFSTGIGRNQDISIDDDDDTMSDETSSPTLDGVLPVSDLFYRSSQALSETEEASRDDEELPFSAEQSDKLATGNRIRVRRNQAKTAATFPTKPIKRGRRSSSPRKMVRRGMEMLVGGVPINADPPQRYVDLMYCHKEAQKVNWYEVITMNTRDFGPLLHGSSAGLVSKVEHGLFCEHFVHYTSKWDVCPKDLRAIVKSFGSQMIGKLDNKEMSEEFLASKNQNSKNQSTDNKPDIRSDRDPSYQGRGSGPNENASQGFGTLTSYSSTFPIDPDDEESDLQANLGGELVFAIGVTREELESGDSPSEVPVLERVLARGIAASTEISGFSVVFTKLVLTDLEDGSTLVTGEFRINLKDVESMTFGEMERKAHRINSCLAQAMDEGDMQLAMAAAAREEVAWPEAVRNRVVEEFLFDDDDGDGPWESKDDNEGEDLIEHESDDEDTVFEGEQLNYAEVAPTKDGDDEADNLFGIPGSVEYSKDDIFLGGGNDGVFWNYSEENAENSPYGGSLGLRLVEAVVERAKQRHPRVIAIGDVHGCIDELQELLRQCDYRPGDLVVFLGDLVSKGPDSISVVQMAREIGAIGVRGNHDFEVIRWHQAIKNGVDPPVVGSEHFHIASCLTKADMKWMYNLPWYISSRELGALFVHAGFVSGIRLAKQNPRLMMNMRSILPDGTVTSKFFNNWPWARLWDGPQTVLFGHDADRGLQQYEHAIGLDTGCVYGGRLTACILPEKRLVSVSARREYFKYRRKHYD